MSKQNKSWSLRIWMPLMILCMLFALGALQIYKYESNSLIGHLLTVLAFSIFILLFEHV